MKAKKIVSIVLASITALGVLAAAPACKKTKHGDQYTSDGKLKVSMRNLYFTDWSGGDAYTKIIEDKFNISITATPYSWADWTSQVTSAVTADNLTDVFHFNLDSYNFANTYGRWVKGGDIKALPDDLTPWPNLKTVLENTTNLDSLKQNGKLYCIPISKDIKNTSTDYSPFTYIYRRDWAKQLGVYQENDDYTWEQFIALLDKFKKEKCATGDIMPLIDVEWGYPSVINFYKTAPHCYAKDSEGKVVATYTTPEFLEGLELAKQYSTQGSSKQYYMYDQYNAKAGEPAKKYKEGRAGVFFENLSLANYSTIRNTMKARSELNTPDKLDDATAIMKVRGADGKYVLEGTDNWFSATFFSSYVSDAKMKKVLDMMDWLLSEEGTMMATYGIEGYDYDIVKGEVVLNENGWEKNLNGEYVEKNNGAKYLRYTCTLGYDIYENDPLINKRSLAILNDWYAFMNDKQSKGELKVLKEDPEVKWSMSPKKAENSGALLENANAQIIKYANGRIDLSTFTKSFSSSTWTQVLTEINNSIGK